MSSSTQRHPFLQEMELEQQRKRNHYCLIICGVFLLAVSVSFVAGFLTAFLGGIFRNNACDDATTTISTALANALDKNY